MTSIRVCPVCQQQVNSDAEYFATHVNRCLDGRGTPPPEASTSAGGEHCPVCSLSFQSLSLPATGHLDHINACLINTTASPSKPHKPTLRLRLDQVNRCPLCDCQLAGLDAQAHVDECAEEQLRRRHGFEWDEQQELHPYQSALPSRGHSRQASAASTSDSTVQGQAGLFPILQALLERSHASGHHSDTSKLCSPLTLHIPIILTDAGYGCGFRCFQMLFSAARHCSAYRQLFPLQADAPIPSIRDMQHLLEEAWQAGYDPSGREHFDGHIVGRRKWIGTTELFVIFTYLGFRAQIIDFPESREGPHLALAVWVKDYFNTEDAQPVKSPDTPKKRGHGNAFDKMMRSHGRACTQTTRQPLFLQHQGHSRVIVGVEYGKTDADTWLILFDPSLKTKPKMRKAAEAAAQRDGAKRLKEDLETTIAASGSSTDSDETHGKAHRRSRSKSPGQWLKHLSKQDDSLDLDDHRSLLSAHRVSLSSLGKKSQYQVLYVQAEGPPLSTSQRLARRTPTSQRIT